jgi:hypothetical protein
MKKAMTYAELAAAIGKMTQEQQDMELTLEFNGEFFPAEIRIVDESDILDAGHPVVTAQK